MSSIKPKFMLKVGITGGIGSGKTTVCKIFEQLGIPVYYADERAKHLMVQDAEVIQQLKHLFGEQTYLADGQLNRAHLASIVFQDKKKLAQLNNIVHPAVYRDGDKWHSQQLGKPYTLKEAALLFEGEGHKYLDKIITVFAPKALRIDRVMQRDEVAREAVEARIANQLPDIDKLNKADYIIINNGQQPLLPQVLSIHRQLVQLSTM